MYTLGINLSHHSSVALLKDNQVVFNCLEERFNRKKDWGGLHSSAPVLALKRIREFTDKIDYVCAVSGSKEKVQQSVSTLQKFGIQVGKTLVNNQAHHLYHAAAGFFMSHFDNASCIVIDGAGSTFQFSSRYRCSETTSVYEISFQQGIKCTHKHFIVGVPNVGGTRGFINRYVKFGISSTEVEITPTEQDNFIKKFPNIKSVKATNNIDTGLKYFGDAVSIAEQLGWRWIGSDGKMMGLSGYGGLENPTACEAIAYRAQKNLERDFLERIKLCQSSNIVISGGCALNILGNSLLKRTYPDYNFFIDPVAHDGTLALGAAAFNYYNITKSRQKLVFGPYSGIDYKITKDDLYECIRKYSV